jgi:hypothetical protein
MSDLRSGSADLASKPLARAVASAFGKPGLLVAAAGLVLSPAAFAATYTVGNTNDNGSSSLRDAIAQANANPGADTIDFAANVSGTITLTTGSLVITDDVTIQGPGASVLTIDGGGSVTRANKSAAYYGFYGSDIVINGEGGGQDRPSAPQAAGAVTISGLTLTGGHAENGGAINAYNTALVVNNCVITGNYAYDSGGGIFIGGYNSTLSVSSSTISNNSAYKYGGGVATNDEGAAITIQQSSLTGNSAKYGGGVFVHNDNDHALTITGSTISGNRAVSRYFYFNGYYNSYSGYYGGNGGGVLARRTPFVISNSTIANNTADSVGGGIASDGGDYAATLSNSTISGNRANYAGGIVQYGVYLTLTNSVIAGNTANLDPDTGNPGNATIAAAFSLIEDTGGSTITDNGGNLLNVAPQLGALANNGGPTLTMLPLAGSPLINAGDPAFSGLTTDQRGTGFPRIIGGRVDIGAVESGTAVVAAATIPAPALGLGGKLGLGALLGLAGLAVARRRRNLGTAAGILLAAALGVSSPTPALAKAKYAAQGGQESRHSEATTITSFTVQGKIVTIVLGDGQTIKTAKSRVHTVDKRSSASHRLVRNPAKVTSGTPAAVRYEIGRNGHARDVSIRLTDTLEQAQSLIAHKP